MSDTTTTIESLLELPKKTYAAALDVRAEAMATGREAWLTSLGAVGVVEVKANEVIDAVVERQAELAKKGVQVEKKGRARVDAVVTRLDVEGRRRAAARRVETTIGSVTAPFAATLRRLGLPTREEVGELTTKVELLTRRVNTLITKLEEQQTARPVFAVKAREDGWQIVQEGIDTPVAVHGTKDEAVEKGRALAVEAAPSQLVVYKKDGTIQDTFEYDV